MQHWRLVLVPALLLAICATLNLTSPAIAQAPDYDVPGGHFYTQANAGAGAGPGFTILDDNNARFWSEFKRLGGVNVLGYPISNRFIWDGFLVQATQREILQWRPESNSVAYVNVYDRLHDLGQDGWLQAVRSTPPPADTSGDASKSFEQVRAAHQAWLDANPAIKAKYFSAADPLQVNGLPMAPIFDAGPFFIVRDQRNAIQQWKVNNPASGVKAGDVTVTLGGDDAKAAGILPDKAALTPSGPVAPNTPTLPPPTPTPAATATPVATPTPAASPTPTPLAAGAPEQTVVAYFNALSNKDYAGAFNMEAPDYKNVRTLDNIRSQLGRFASYKIIGVRTSTKDQSYAYVAVGYDGITSSGQSTAFAGAFRLRMNSSGQWMVDGVNTDERVMSGDTDPNNPYSAVDLYLLAIEAKSWDQAFAMESPSLQGSVKASDLSNTFGSYGQFYVRQMSMPDSATVTCVVGVNIGGRIVTYDASYNVATNNGLWQVNAVNSFNQRT